MPSGSPTDFRCASSHHATIRSATAHGLEIFVPLVNVNTTVTLHFIVAENEFPEAVELSTWYAIDLDHHAVVAQQPDGALVGRHLGRSEDPPERRLTTRASLEICRRVGEELDNRGLGRPASSGSAGPAPPKSVVDSGDLLIAADDRLDRVSALGVDGHTFQHANARRRTQMAATFVDIGRGPRAVRAASGPGPTSVPSLTSRSRRLSRCRAPTGRAGS